MDSSKYCPICHCSVAQFDPERIVEENLHYHRNCWKKSQPVNNCRVRQERQKVSIYSWVKYQLTSRQGD